MYPIEYSYHHHDIHAINQESEATMTVAEKEQWVPLSIAAQRIGISQSKLSLMVKRGEVKSKKDPRDKRKTYCDLRELNRIFFTEE
jgi:hypothetical protein